MQITWFGHSFFKIEAKNHLNQEVVILIDPYTDQKGAVPRNLKADLVLLSRGPADTIALSGEPAIISSPGEYEIKGIMIYTQVLKKTSLVFQVSVENVAVAHLGRLGATPEKEAEELADKLGVIDVLLLPVGGHDVLDSQGAAALASQLESRLAVPMFFNPPGGKENYEPVDKFLKLMGQKEVERLPKLKIAKKDLPAEETKVVLLEKS